MTLPVSIAFAGAQRILTPSAQAAPASNLLFLNKTRSPGRKTAFV